MEADIATQSLGLASNTDFSLISLFLRADIIVKSVIIILILSSIYSWAIIFEKIRMFRKINKSAEEFEENFGNLNPQKLFITVYHQISKTQWQNYLKVPCKQL